MLLVTLAGPVRAAVLIPFGATWKYLDNGSNPGTTWVQPGFDDSTWASGPAQLGYGDGDEATVVQDNATPGYNVNDTDRYLTTYFRSTFVIGNPAQYQSLELHLVRDDGAVVYVNGSEVWRNNMPDTAIGYQTAALTALGTSEEILVLTNALSTAFLVPGTNLVAVEVHQVLPSSSDLSFDLELAGQLASPPVISLARPSAGASFVAPATVPCVADATDTDGTVVKVEFFRDGAKLGETTTRPFTYSWAGVAAGTYSLTAIATDNQGLTNSSPAVTITVSAPMAPVTNTLVALGSTWTYLDNGTDQGTAWQQRTFNDAAWKSGLAQFGYGDGDEATVVEDNATPGYVRADTDRYITTYFRQAFVVADPAAYASLMLQVVFDDGAVVYLNGAEVFRCNMPAGTILYHTPAILSGVSDNATWSTNLPASLLLAGTNVVTVEIHQDSPDSSDVSFDSQLLGVTAGTASNTPPVITLAMPADGASFTTPTNIALTATASDPDGTVAWVEFRQDANRLGDDESNAYEWTWSNPPAGSYALTAVAVDSQGATSTSAPVNITVVQSAQPTTNVLVAAGSTWKYLDNGSDQGTAWRARAFADGAWASGPAPLGYCGASCSYTLATPTLGYGADPDHKYPTTYFRRTFAVPDPARVLALQLDLLYDDGAVVYLNGQEVYRVGMPEGAVDYLAFATTAGTFTPIQVDLPSTARAALVAGDNVLAIEIHQGTASSSDIVIEAALRAVIGSGGNLAPAVSVTQPGQGAAFTVPVDLTVSASASDLDGGIARVEFYQNSTKLGEDTTSPYAVLWSAVPIGIYALSAVATDNLGARSTSNPVNITVTEPSATTTNTLIALGSTWKYLDDGTDQGAAWTGLSFNDSAWRDGPGQLGFGDGDETTIINGGPITFYFRQTIVVTDADLCSQLLLLLLRDDGGVVYLNGVEVFRSPNVPAGSINYQTLVANAPDNTVDQVTFAAAALREGTNVVAVEIHQSAPSSTDLSFDLQLRGVFTPPSNYKPTVSLTSPANGLTVAAPANLSLAANASDRDGTVTNVAFLANGTKLADDAAAPYAFAWNNVPAGVYQLAAVATDDLGLSATSVVATITVSTDTAAPVIAGKVPGPGAVTNLQQIAVTFSKNVVGVDAADLLVNGVAATNVSGSGSTYTFQFPQPGYGTVTISWAAGHGITDVFTPPHAFDRTGPGATWQYQLLDVVPPFLAGVDPVPGSIVAALTNVAVLFSEAVVGVHAADLRINSAPATTVSGSGAGPYTFGFAQPAQGPVQLSWAAGHGIQDSAGNAFAGALWGYELDTNVTGVILSEIMYHPASENVLEEYIELYNKGAGAVNLAAWRFTAGVQFTFPSVSIPAGGYLVVAADLATFTNKYPGVSNVIGNWVGLLSNAGEDIDLDDALGRRVDSVRYADEGDWAIRQRGRLDRNHRGWTWYKEHDGLGKSLELINPLLSNNSGQNWAASAVTNGTPGRANSVLNNNVAPLILNAAHSPIIPRSTNAVVITAHILDEAAGSATVTLFYRSSVAPPGAFGTLPMHDDGVSGDTAAGDSIYSAVIPAQPNNTVIEWYVQTTDLQNHSRTWPGPAIAAPDGVGPTGQVVNALFQVDDTSYAGSQPLYKIILTEAERAELRTIPGDSNNQGPNAQMNATFISIDGAGIARHYLVGVRDRGHYSRAVWPMNYRVNFRTDDPWKSVTGLNLNTRDVHIQHFGAVISRKAGADGRDGVAAQVRVNNENLATSGAPMHGSYAALEAYDGGWAENHFPNDPNGNIYRAVRDIPPPTFDYRGTNINTYTNTWFKETNLSENDWADLLGMLGVIGINNPTPFTTESARSVINVEQWLRHLAVMNLLGNSETGLNSGYNDDYYTYAGVLDRRFVLLYHDLDQILGEGGSFGPTSDIFSATGNNGAGQALSRLIHWPEFEPIYYRILKELLDTTFSKPQFDALMDQTLGSYVNTTTIASMKSWMDSRRAYVLAVLPTITVSNAPVALVTGTPRSPTPLRTASFTVSGDWITHYRYQLNGGSYGAERTVATPINLSGLANGTNVVAVIGKNASGVWQAEAQATVRSWVVNTAWPAVRLNEVLAWNATAVNRGGSFPDVIELYNEGSSPVNLAGMQLTDDPSSPAKFVFPAGATLAAGGYLVLDENALDFALNQDGEGVYLYDSFARGGALLDSVAFGLQLADLSIGRISGGEWQLTRPTFGSANLAQTVGDPHKLKINEWLAAPQNPFLEDFIELYNPEPLPVALGGLYLTDHPLGVPQKHALAPLSFITSNGFASFIADGQADQADHVNFHLALEQGFLALFGADGSSIDSVIYGPQWPGVSSGRCPDGALHQTALQMPTPGTPNACPYLPPPPVTFPLVALTQSWAYDSSGNDLGTTWSQVGFNDSSWPTGRGVLGFDNGNNPFVQNLTNTVLPLTTSGGAEIVTFYFRTHFTYNGGTPPSTLVFTNLMDDGAIVYLNGVEVYRLNMPTGPVTAATRAAANAETTSFTEITVPWTDGLLLIGDNLLAVELHQSLASDCNMGLGLGAVVVTNSAALAGIQLNEVLANNASMEDTNGFRPDWVEIYNPSSNAVDLVDMSLTDNPANPRRWVFPAGSVLPAQGFRQIRMDADAPASSTNTGFGLKSTGGSIYLYYPPANGGGLASGLTYGLQAADFTLGRVPDGSTNWVLCIPSAGGANIAASLGDSRNLKVNEWMANPVPGNDDWFELFNPNAQPVNVAGLYVSDSLLNRTKYLIPPLSFIGAGPYGFQRFWADENPTAGPDHVSFKLAGSGEALVVSDASGTVIDGLTFGLQTEGLSQGRLPDGTATIVPFPGTATPENSNFLPLENIVVNEVLSHSDPPLEDAIELHNLTGADVDISGWYLSDSPDNLMKYRIPNGTVIAARGFRVFYEYQFNSEAAAQRFSLSSAKGDRVYLSQSFDAGVLTGYRAFAEFGPAENGVSFGRYLTSVGVDFTAMSTRTFGVDNPATTNEFEVGRGKTNAYPKVGPVVINEIMYHPLNTNDVLEYVELHNILATPVPLYDTSHPQNTWRVRQGIDFNFPTNIAIPGGGFLVLVNFSPDDLAARAEFEAVYGTGMTLVGPYSGSLDNAGEAIELRKPDAPQLVAGPDFGLVPYVTVDRVVYSDFAPWPVTPDGQGDVLARATPSLYGNDPQNWIAAAPTPGQPNFSGFTNTAPVLNPIGNRSVNEGTALSFTASATDAEAPLQSITYTLDPGAPEGASIDPLTGVFTWRPTEAQGPGAYPITVRVTDSGSPIMSDFEPITVTVNEVNAAPVLAPIGDKIVAEGTPVTFTASALDLDSPLQTLTYSLDPGAPAGASIDPVSGQFVWPTSETNGPGVYPVTIRVRDSGSPILEDFETLQITVNELNSTPALNPISDQFVDAGKLLTFTATATDPDRPAQTLTFALGAGAPSGASITPAGTFTWSPALSHSPVTNLVSIQVADNGAPPLTNTTQVRIIVIGAPELITIAREPGGGMRLTWTAFPGKSYQLRYAAVLSASPAWANAGGLVTATGTTASTVDASGGTGQRFYRIEVAP